VRRKPGGPAVSRLRPQVRPVVSSRPRPKLVEPQPRELRRQPEQPPLIRRLRTLKEGSRPIPAPSLPVLLRAEPKPLCQGTNQRHRPPPLLVRPQPPLDRRRLAKLRPPRPQPPRQLSTSSWATLSSASSFRASMKWTCGVAFGKTGKS